MLIDTFNSFKVFLKIHNQHRLNQHTANSLQRLEIYIRCITCQTIIKIDEVIYNNSDLTK